jgi:hypothetical protein
MVKFLAGLILGLILTVSVHTYFVSKASQERMPGVTEEDVQQLPPGAKNLKSLGNRWLTFEMEDKTYYMHRASSTNLAPMIFPK